VIWFDTEIRDVFGIDAFATTFDHSRRWELIGNDHWRVSVMRADLADHGKQQALGHLLERYVPPLVHSNVGSHKSYASVCAAFKQQLQLSLAYLDRLYAAPVTRHFFNDE